MFSRRSRIELLAALAVVAVALLIAGVVVFVGRDGTDVGGPRTTDQPVPTTSPSDIAIPTAPSTTGTTSQLPAADPAFPSIGPARFPSAECSNTANGKFVAPNGNDANPGTASAPFRTVAFGVQSMKHGDTLFVRAGTYYNLSPTGERDKFVELDGLGKGSADKWLRICAYPGERPVLVANDTDAGAVLVRGTDYVHVEGFEIIGPAFGRSVSPPRGAHAVGVWVGRFPDPKTESNHTRIWNNWIHGFGSSGIQLNLSNNTDIRGNFIWDNAHWSHFATSGISLFWQSAGAGNDSHGYGNYIVGNLLWDNYMDDSLFDPGSPFGLTDGNCIIIDENGHYTDSGSKTRTLIRNNICVGNGGPGVALARSANVEIANNTFYQNNRTKLETVVKNGEFMCQGMQGRDRIEGRPVMTNCDRVSFADNVVVGRPDRPNIFATYFQTDVQFDGNVWVRSGFKPKSSSDRVLETGAPVVRSPNMTDPRAGDWTTVDEAAGKGAWWPLDPR